MASILRQIVAGPRAKHQETGLDLCYVTSNIIATSGPSQTYPQRAYRNPLDRLVAFLDARHGDDWAIWEFRAEGTGYPDEAVHGRIRHFPWPDHHPPPFALVPRIVGGMRRWLDGGALSAGPARDGDDDGGHDDDAGAGGNKKKKEEEEEKKKKKKKKETGEGEEEGQVQGNAGEGGIGGGQGDGKGNGQGKRKGKRERVVVVHCKAGKGRSGTMACSYLIAECGWSAEDALARFTERRMRPGFGAGVSIPSQLRWVSYVDRWARAGKRYVDRPVEVVEVRVWGLRHGVKLAVEGFADEGRKIRVFHTFKAAERFVVEPGAPGGEGILDMVQDMAGYGARAVVDETGEVAEDADYREITKGAAGSNGEDKGGVPSRSSSKKLKTSRTAGLMGKLSGRKRGSSKDLVGFAEASWKSKTFAAPGNSAEASSGASSPAAAGQGEPRSQSTTSLQNEVAYADPSEPGGRVVTFRPSEPIRIPNSDVNISVERRNRAPASVGLTMVTAVAHVWFNAFFEGNGPEQDGRADESGVFEIDWDKMDGIKGSSRRGTRALDRLAVVWRVAGSTTGQAGPENGEGKATTPLPGVAINEPGKDSPVPQLRPADWKGGNDEDPAAGKRLGLRAEDPESRSVSKASSVRSGEQGGTGGGGSGVTRGERQDAGGDDDDQISLEGVKVSGPAGEDVLAETPAGEGPTSSAGDQGARERDNAIL
ncbi:uncharacterized protein P884DRAFT_244886 [Thermothelomyces heterothallicus CBS 202.75]|uniref:uncharacterized protein n=1 Tax=Thermothelomyces heterothallicus CBS 202.75 TaxID=1149848 RepID=UPI003743E911